MGSLRAKNASEKFSHLGTFKFSQTKLSFLTWNAIFILHLSLTISLRKLPYCLSNINRMFIINRSVQQYYSVGYPWHFGADLDSQIRTSYQGFESRSGLDPYSIGPVDPDPDSESVSGSWSRRAKMTHKSRIFFLKFTFWSVGWPLLWAVGFFCNLT